MKTCSWLLAFGLLACSGCARHYTITLSNGSQIGAHGKPRLDNGVYVFKDALGRETFIPASRVREIGPASAGKSSANSSH